MRKLKGTQAYDAISKSGHGSSGSSRTPSMNACRANRMYFLMRETSPHVKGNIFVAGGGFVVRMPERPDGIEQVLGLRVSKCGLKRRLVNEELSFKEESDQLQLRPLECQGVIEFHTKDTFALVSFFQSCEIGTHPS